MSFYAASRIAVPDLEITFDVESVGARRPHCDRNAAATRWYLLVCAGQVYDNERSNEAATLAWPLLSHITPSPRVTGYRFMSGSKIMMRMVMPIGRSLRLNCRL